MSYLYVDDGILGTSDGKPLILFLEKYNNGLLLIVTGNSVKKYVSYINDKFELTDYIKTIFSPQIPIKGRIYKYNKLKLKNKIKEYTLYMSNDLNTEFKYRYNLLFYIIIIIIFTLLIILIIFIYKYKYKMNYTINNQKKRKY